MLGQLFQGIIAGLSNHVEIARLLAAEEGADTTQKIADEIAGPDTSPIDWPNDTDHTQWLSCSWPACRRWCTSRLYRSGLFPVAAAAVKPVPHVPTRAHSGRAVLGIGQVHGVVQPVYVPLFQPQNFPLTHGGLDGEGHNVRQFRVRV